MVVEEEPLIDAKEVGEIFEDCLYKGEKPNCETSEDTIVVEGVVHNFAIDLSKLEKHADRVAELLGYLPTNFHKSGGGGWSFLQMCDDRNGVQWTGFHMRMEQLLVLGIALKKARIQVPRDMWKVFPGGVPYLVVDV